MLPFLHEKANGTSQQGRLDEFAAETTGADKALVLCPRPSASITAIAIFAALSLQMMLADGSNGCGLGAFVPSRLRESHLLADL